MTSSVAGLYWSGEWHPQLNPLPSARVRVTEKTGEFTRWNGRSGSTGFEKFVQSDPHERLNMAAFISIFFFELIQRRVVRGSAFVELVVVLEPLDRLRCIARLRCWIQIPSG